MELLTTTEMDEADRAAIASGIAGIDLMERAGTAVADAVTLAHPARGRVVVVAGPGNNGGDGFIAARCLSERGYTVRVLLLGKPSQLKADAAEAAQRWGGDTEALEPEQLQRTDVLIDALFGAGLARPVDGEAHAMIEAMNASGAHIVAVDLPSGINGDTGAIMGAAVQAHQTVTFFRRKPGHVLLPGRLHCGRVVVADIGIPADVLTSIRPRTFLNSPGQWGSLFPIPKIEGHKYARGHAVVISGGLSASTGAARLASRGALRAGAGLVTIASPRDALVVNANSSLAVMVRAVDGVTELQSLLEDRRINAILLGPGGGTGASMRDNVLCSLEGERGVVLDADALTSFGDNPENLFTALSNRSRQPTILTPHEGEFSRLFKQILKNHSVKQKLEVCRYASHETRAVVLLKGPDTVVAAPDGRAAIAENAPPWLATAGSGDVLAGLATGLLAQGMPAFEAACAAVWLHGEAANRAGPGLISEDLPEALPAVYRHLFPEIAR
ncbi:MAG: NAD(P)H-hydrate dehydratase [Pseudorhodoplanes sp.]|nr:NAD(P)H-hydrate dehydratase [Pseudorhodoplanes sp.]